jgi:thiamine-monophosphate kinase
VAGEFDLIQRYFTRPAPNALLGVGDDAALLQAAPGMVLAVSTDMLVSGQHFFPDADPYFLGRKSLAVNLSDMAAMGATPRWFTLSIALPEADDAWLARFSAGLFSQADAFDVSLVGGDTTAGPLNICIQIMGEVPANGALRRDAAKAGDEVWVSGALGDAALALAHLQNRCLLDSSIAAQALARLHDPTPRVALGAALRGISQSAIDISDGLLGDLGHILERSQVGAKIDLTKIPMGAAARQCSDRNLAQQAILAGGDDYELCFTAHPDLTEIINEISRELNLPLTKIGEIVAAPGLVVIGEDGKMIATPNKGFDHFA